MKQDEIIRMAREAGVWDEIGYPKCIERFAALVSAHEAEKWKAENKRDYENWKMAAEKAAECEREACAKVCESKLPFQEDYDFQKAAGNTARACAAAIRARGEK